MADKKNYQATLLLPKTEFPMRAGLAQGEPITLARWEKMGLYQKQRAKQRGKPKYILHDGPPYANGNIHIGHALNKILKDIISRSQNMMGKDSPYVPGWDCHGLPIEWKVEEDLRAQGKNKNDIPVNEFRKLCRDYATKWLNIQREEFKRLGVLGDWDNPYSTMDYKSEAIIAGEIGKVAMDKRGGAISHDFLFKDYRPVMWSIPEQTALAEAEVEYKDVTTRAVYVAFKFFDCNTRQELKDNITNQGDVNKNVEKLKDCEVIIWTTTPWTLPANCAIAFNKNIDYATYDIIDFNGKARRVALAEKLAQEVAEKCKWQKIILNDKLDSNNLTYVFNESRDIFHDVLVRRESDKYCIRFEHPLYNYNPQGVIPDPRFLRQLVNADFVTADAGTGFVHIAPAHGKDDALLIKHMDGRVNALKKDGFYHEFITKLIPELTNVSVYDEKGKDGGANQGVIAALKRVDALVGVENYKHSYPHSWRSKAPIIFLSTPQWFINMDSEDAIYEELEDGGMGGPIDFSDKNSLRQKALQALEEVVAYPANGKSALTDMIANRPDWCISRQRAWGVPLPLFAKKFVNEGESLLLRNAKLFARVREVFEKEGADAWFNDAKYPNSFWLKDIVPEAHYNKYEKIKDVVDVWFDSGSTHAFVLAQRPEFRHEGEKGEDVIADLYLEGTDQHRGWFHSSLLESVATTSRSLLESFETTSESVLEPVATRGRAPYKALLTHGFVLDEKGNKMSKSLGNVTAPEDVIREHGADILRLWVVASNYTENLTIGKNILTQHSESYRRIRNTFRWLLGVIETDPREPQEYKKSQLPLLEQYMLRRLAMLGRDIKKHADVYEFNKVFSALYRFCDQDLSAFYFDVRKDSLYCDSLDSEQRKQTMFVIDKIFDSLCKWFAPILCFTAEEAWRAHPRNKDNPDATIHMEEFPELPDEWLDGNLDEQVEDMMEIRKNVLQVLEIARKDKKIGSGLAAAVTLTLPPKIYESATAFDLADIFIVSDVKVQSGDELKIEWQAASGEKCERCWKIMPEVTQNPEKLCKRCHGVVAAM